MTTAAPRRPPPAPPKAAPPSNGHTVAAKTMTFGKAKIAKAAEGIVVNAIEGWGKTNLGCHAPKPVILMARGETGYLTLRRHGRVPEVDTIVDEAGEPASLQSWAETLSAMEMLVADPIHESVVFDALNGFERLAHEFVCNRDFEGQFDKFGDYGKGPEVSIHEIAKFVSILERIKSSGKHVVILSHAKVKPYKNPVGPDYDRFTADCHDKTWAMIAKWADCVLFGKFNEATELAKRTGNIAKDRGKGIGGTDRIIYTEPSAAWVAKNRYGMPSEISIPDDPTQAWNTIYTAINGQEQA
jgi:hypothetical protein